MTDLVNQLKARIVETLNLQDVDPQGIDPGAPLFGAGLGLDSIDALELVVMVERSWGIKITNIEVGRQAFASVNSLAVFIRANAPA